MALSLTTYACLDYKPSDWKIFWR